MLTHSQVDIKVNSEFARRFQHNKEREERQRLEQKLKHSALKRSVLGEEDGESSSEDEDEDVDMEEELQDVSRVLAALPVELEPDRRFVCFGRRASFRRCWRLRRRTLGSTTRRPACSKKRQRSQTKSPRSRRGTSQSRRSESTGLH